MVVLTEGSLKDLFGCVSLVPDNVRLHSSYLIRCRHRQEAEAEAEPVAAVWRRRTMLSERLIDRNPFLILVFVLDVGATTRVNQTKRSEIPNPLAHMYFFTSVHTCLS